MKINLPRVIKATAFLGALLTGVAMLLGGDVVNGLGIIAASLSSASVLAKD